MKSKAKIDAGYSQLRWVILLLAIAVILPTVCLLWFMTQAVKNERLAVRQKLVDMYTKRVENLFLEYSEDAWNSIEDKLTDYVDRYKKKLWLFPENYISRDQQFSAFVVYADKGVLYPITSPVKYMMVPSDHIQQAWSSEYVEKNYEQAIKQYGGIGKISSIPHVVYECQMGIVRCLSKQDKFKQAIEICWELAYPGKHIINEYTPAQIGRARLMLANLYGKANHEDLPKELQRQFLNSKIANDPDFTPLQQIPTETRVFILNELIGLAKASGLDSKLKTDIEKAQQIINSELISITAADFLDSNPSLQSWPEKTFKRIQNAQPLYGIKFYIYGRGILGLITSEKMSEFWQKATDDMNDEMVFCRVLDDTGKIIAGQQEVRLGRKVALGERFLTRNLGNFFPNWKVEVYFRGGIFTTAAKRQRITYFWIAALVIGFMALITGMAVKAILRQAQLNKLKNDFIATVTHELKTPLSSMRVLVDTLIEGNYKEEKTATEYLQLISKENVRLSRLIDNFLTFSRMERNKQAFDIVKTNPAEIAKSAAEAIQTKFNHESCKFSITIDDNLPDISADKDAMVTVLVNLLDNAYKYSSDDKQIELKVFAQEDKVRFSVKDNGIGMTRRQTKRVFDRFYQADSSLSRQSEGTGLGLSIVKFIIDAHKGQITVESKPSKGSEFVVKLPVACK